MKKSIYFALILILAISASTVQASNGARAGSVSDATPPLATEGGDVNEEGFDDITTLPALGWIEDNQSTPNGVAGYFQGNPAVFSAHMGDPDSYLGVNFNSTAGNNQICNWMILPDLGNVGSLTFWTRTVTGNTFPDRLRVLFSPSGGTNTGACAGDDFGDFTEELVSINDGLGLGGFPQVWTEFTVNPGAAGRIAFVYDVSSGGPGGANSNYIGIDTVSWEAGALDQARFLVTKDFNDDNPAEVEVTLTCNTGIPLTQTTTISEGDPVNFVIGDFEQGELNCTVTEGGLDGYTTTYFDGENDSCAWEDLVGAQYACEITNSLDLSQVEVGKVWIDDNPQFNAINVAEAEWSCSPVPFGEDSGYLNFVGNPAEDGFGVYPYWNGGTTCTVNELALPDGGVESDGSECVSLLLFPGENATCTIFNTRIYEGIPTLSHYGLAVLALVMLGVGMIGFRRFV